jgi:hypothetical protein
VRKARDVVGAVWNGEGGIMRLFGLGRGALGSEKGRGGEWAGVG